MQSSKLHRSQPSGAHLAVDLAGDLLCEPRNGRTDEKEARLLRIIESHTSTRSETSFVRTWGGEFKLVRRRESKRKLSALLGLLQTEIDKSTDLLAKIGNVFVTETPERRCARSSRILENRTLRLVPETIDEKGGRHLQVLRDTKQKRELSRVRLDSLETKEREIRRRALHYNQRVLRSK